MGGRQQGRTVSERYQSHLKYFKVCALKKALHFATAILASKNTCAFQVHHRSSVPLTFLDRHRIKEGPF